MQAKKLAFQVSIISENLFGREAKITVRPSNQRGWYWQFDAEESPILISAKLLHFKKRRLVLQHETKSLNIYEHIGALKWTGLDNVIISCDAWPPYDGRSWELYHTLRPCIQNTDRLIQWCTTDQEISVEFSGLRSGFTRIIPDTKKSLRVIVISKYEGLGKKTLTLNFPAGNGTFEEIFKAFAPGWPPKLFYLQKLASLFGWPHLKKSLWPKSCQSKDQALEQFALHRATDLLGALSLIHPYRLLSGTVISYCSGHWADTEVVKRSQPHMQLID